MRITFHRLRLTPSRWLVAPSLALLVGLGLGITGWSVNVIDANPDFAAAGTVVPRQSRGVAVAAALILREIDVHAWTANDPFFQPGWLLHDMPAYQQGIIAALANFAAGLSERRADTPGDAPLATAASMLRYPGTVWRFNLSVSWMPTTSTEKQYRRAAHEFEAYNLARLDGAANFDRRPEALAAALADIGRDLGTASALGDEAIAQRLGGLFDRRPASVFYGNKGRVYADSLLLRELGWDYAQTIADHGLGAQWRRLLDAASAAAALAPALVFNGAPDSTFLPSHLAAQGYALLRVRQQLAEIGDSLLKPIVPAAQ